MTDKPQRKGAYADARRWATKFDPDDQAETPKVPDACVVEGCIKPAWGHSDKCGEHAPDRSCRN